MDASGPLPRLPSRGSRHCCSSETAAPKTRRVRCCCWWCGLASAGRRRAAGTHPCSVAWHLELGLERAVCGVRRKFVSPCRAAPRVGAHACVPASCFASPPLARRNAKVRVRPRATHQICRFFTSPAHHVPSYVLYTCKSMKAVQVCDPSVRTRKDFSVHKNNKIVGNFGMQTY